MTQPKDHSSLSQVMKVHVTNSCTEGCDSITAISCVCVYVCVCCVCVCVCVRVCVCVCKDLSHDQFLFFILFFRLRLYISLYCVYI